MIWVGTNDSSEDEEEDDDVGIDDRNSIWKPGNKSINNGSIYHVCLLRPSRRISQEGLSCYGGLRRFAEVLLLLRKSLK